MKWNAKLSTSFELPSSWQQLQRGTQYQEVISQYFAAWSPNVLGYQWLKLGGLSGEIQCPLPLRHHIIIAPQITQNLTALSLQEDTSVVQSRLSELPLVEKSIDMCIMANTLNFSQDPHQILRETTRVLCDDGYLFLSLFNPFSRLGMKRHLNLNGQTPLPFRHFCAWRVIDWLELLNFDILATQRLALANEVPYLGSLVAIIAKKRTYPLNLTPQKIKFRSHKGFNTVEAFNEIRE